MIVVAHLVRLVDCLIALFDCFVEALHLDMSSSHVRVIDDLLRIELDGVLVQSYCFAVILLLVLLVTLILLLFSGCNGFS